eukprot:2108150-Amphidinium_carterae.1
MNYAWYGKKTVLGSLAVWFFAFISLDVPGALARAILAVLCALAEAFGGTRFDNAAISSAAGPGVTRISYLCSVGRSNLHGIAKGLSCVVFCVELGSEGVEERSTCCFSYLRTSPSVSSACTRRRQWLTLGPILLCDAVILPKGEFRNCFWCSYLFSFWAFQSVTIVSASIRYMYIRIVAWVSRLVLADLGVDSPCREDDRYVRMVHCVLLGVQGIPRFSIFESL